MKRRNPVLFLALAVCLSLSGCAHDTSDLSPYTDVNTLEGLWIEVKGGTVSPTGLTVTFHNDTDQRISYGAWFRLEEPSGGQWYSVEPIAPWGQYDWGIILFPQSSGDQDYGWDWYYGALERGDYRIIVEVSVISGETYTEETRTEYYLAAEFQIP